MWCKQLNSTELDETVHGKGCLGRLLPLKSRKNAKDKRAEGPTVCKAKPSVKVSPSTKENLINEVTKKHDEDITGSEQAISRHKKSRSKSKRSSIRGMLFVW